jgi:hypothetical protein
MRKTIFHEDWWLDAAAPGQWHELTCERGGRVAGYLRFVEYVASGMHACQMPQLSRVLGPVVFTQAGKTESRLRFTHSVVTELVGRLAHFENVEMTLDPGFGDLTPFLEAGCDVGVLQTFLLDCRKSSEALWGGMRDKVRNVIRRARERLMVKDIDDADLFVSFYRANLDGEKTYFNLNLVKALFEAAHVRGQGKIVAAIDQAGMVHAKVFFIWDEHTLYYFLSTRDRQIADSGAVSLLIWSGMELAREKGLSFDFDGITSDARFDFMAGFGGEIATRFNVSRTTKLYEAQKGLRNVARAILKPDWLRH